jgi:hypothetical protein
MKKLLVVVAASLFFPSVAMAEKAGGPPVRGAPTEPVSPVPVLLQLSKSGTKIVSIKPLESGFLVVYYREKDRLLVTQQYFAEGVHPEAYYDALILRPELAEYYRSNAVDAGTVLKEFKDYEQKLKERREQETAQVAKAESKEPGESGKAEKIEEEKEKKPFKVKTVRKSKPKRGGKRAK